MLDDEAHRVLRSCRQSARLYKQANAEGNTEKADLHRRKGLVSLQLSKELARQAQQVRASTEPARLKRQLASTVEALVKQARSRAARGDRAGAASSLNDAERFAKAMP
jgi:hypothetical protein